MTSPPISTPCDDAAARGPAASAAAPSRSLALSDEFARFVRSGRAGRSGALALAVGGWSAIWASGLSLLPAGCVWVSAAAFFLGLALIPTQFRRGAAQRPAARDASAQPARPRRDRYAAPRP